MKKPYSSSRRIRRRATSKIFGAAVAVAVSGGVGAVEIPTGNPDLVVRWDNTIRYNLGVRADDCDSRICGDGAGGGDFLRHQSDRKFPKRGDVVTNRLDLLTELDAVWKKNTGFRLSGAGWYDHAYRGGVKGDPALNALPGGAGQNGDSYSDYTERWNRGPSGEFLDAFLFTGFDLSGVPVNVKLGQHNIYWGESLFSFVGGVAYAQGPVDLRKALANPGVEAKEVFRPLNQFSFSADLTDRLNVAGQYFFDWKASPIPDGGTYLGIADAVSEGGGVLLTPAGVARFAGISAEPKDKRGDFGLALRWRPQWLDGTWGFYYREYTDKLPQLVMTGNAGPVPTVFGLDYSTPRQKMFGTSLSKQIGDVAVGSDITYREDAQLMAVPFSTPAGQANLGAGPVGNSLLPTGKVATALVNAIAYFGKTPVFDSAVLMAEFTYTHLVSVTKNGNFFNGEGYGCPGKATNNVCATKNAYGVAVQFSPKWYQVLNGVDLEMPIFVGVGLNGNSAVMFGDLEGQGSFSVGLAADIKNKYNVALKYNGFIAKHGNDRLGAASDNNGLGKWWDRDFISLTVRTTF